MNGQEPVVSAQVLSDSAGSYPWYRCRKCGRLAPMIGLRLAWHGVLLDIDRDYCALCIVALLDREVGQVDKYIPPDSEGGCEDGTSQDREQENPE